MTWSRSFDQATLTPPKGRPRKTPDDTASSMPDLANDSASSFWNKGSCFSVSQCSCPSQMPPYLLMQELWYAEHALKPWKLCEPMMMSFVSELNVIEIDNAYNMKADIILNVRLRLTLPVLHPDVFGPDPGILDFFFVLDCNSHFGWFGAFLLGIEQPNLLDFDAMFLEKSLQRKIWCSFCQIWNKDIPRVFDTRRNTF